jgi:hypothetical protein
MSFESVPVHVVWVAPLGQRHFKVSTQCCQAWCSTPSARRLHEELASQGEALMATKHIVRRLIPCWQLVLLHRKVLVIVAALAALPASAQNTGWLANHCPPYVSPGGQYTNTATPGSQPARCFMCGQMRKYAGDGTTINNPGRATELRPGPYPGVDNGRNYVYDTGNGYAGCRNRDDAQSLQINATELAEIRGWIVRMQGKHLGEDEYEMDILPDLGWTPKAVVAPAPGGVTPINTLDRLTQLAMTPVNMIFAGAPTNYNQIRPPLVPAGGFRSFPFDTAILTPDGAAWGGAYSPVIHIEIDGWGGSGRGYCDTLSTGTGCTQGAGCCSTIFPDGKNWSDEYAPLGWFNDGLDTPNNNSCAPAINCGHTWWPFAGLGDPPSFHPGQYVRVVGTLWKDLDHGENGAEVCWTVPPALKTIGWQEIHGVDYMEPADPPTVSSGKMHYVAGYSICMNPTSAPPYSQQTAIHDSFQIGPQPQPGASLVVAARHYGPVISYDKLDPPWQNAPNVSRAGSSVVVSQGQNIWYANYNVSASVSYTSVGYLNEFIDVYWNMCGAGQCPDPNAPQGCASVSTATDPNNCGACGHQCQPPLNGNGVAACFNGQCSFRCSPNYCPSSTDCVSAPGYTQCGASCGCAAGYSCVNDVCHGCDSTTCPSGCCSNNTCQPGTSTSACGGSGGAACQGCPPGTNACVNQSCVCQPRTCGSGYYFDTDLCRCLCSRC